MKTISTSAFSGSVLLSGVAGYVDAIGFMLSGGLFVSFMSGNSTQAGVDASRGDFTVALLAISLIVGFVAGVVLGRLAGIATREGHVGERLIALSLALLGATGLVHLWPHPGFSLAAVAAIMGALNTLFVADGRPRVAVTYATGTLVSLGLGLAERFAGDRSGAWRRPLVLWIGITLGAVVGAGAWALWGSSSLLLASAVLLVLGITQWVRRGAA